MGGLADAVSLESDTDFSIVCVLEHRPRLEPTKAIHIPAFHLIRNGRGMLYSEIVCHKHNDLSWYEHNPSELLDDRNANAVGTYSVKSNNSIEVRADRNALVRISELLSSFERTRHKILVHCLAGMERAPLVVAFHLAMANGGDFNKAYRVVKQLHSDTQIRAEWL